MKLLSVVIPTLFISSASAFAPNKWLKPQKSMEQKKVFPLSSTVFPEDKNMLSGWMEKTKLVIPGIGKDDVMLEPDYLLAWTFVVFGSLIALTHGFHPLTCPTAYNGQHCDPSLFGILGAGFHFVFAALLFVQTRRVRLVFGKDSFEFFNIKGPALDLDEGAWLEKKPENYVVGGENRWRYDGVVDYGFFPGRGFPLIVWFKEMETPKVCEC